MALVKISELPAADPQDGAEIFPFNQDGSTRKGALRTFIEIRATAPDPDDAPAYIDSSTLPPTLKVWNGSTWELGNADLTTLQSDLDSLEADIDDHVATPHGHPDLATHVAMGLDETD